MEVIPGLWMIHGLGPCYLYQDPDTYTLIEETQRYTGPFELQQAREEDLTLVRDIVEREL